MVRLSILVVDVRVQQMEFRALAIGESAHGFIMDCDPEPLDGSKNGDLSLSPKFVRVPSLSYELLEFIALHVMFHDARPNGRRTLDNGVSHSRLPLFDHLAQRMIQAGSIADYGVQKESILFRPLLSVAPISDPAGKVWLSNRPWIGGLADSTDVFLYSLPGR